MPSIPAQRRARASASGSSQVQAVHREAGGVALARSTSGVTVPTHGCSATWPRPTRHRVHVGRHGDGEPRRRNRRRQLPAAVDRLHAERRDQPPLIVAALPKDGDRRVGERLGVVEVGLVRVVLDLDVDPHPGAGIERLGQRRHATPATRPAASPGSAGRRGEQGRGARRARRRSCGGRRARRRRRPSIAARRKAARVFSGSARDAPRCAITCVTRHAPISHICART